MMRCADILLSLDKRLVRGWLLTLRGPVVLLLLQELNITQSDSEIGNTYLS